jgi:Domain of unknown function (DUF4062)
MEPYRVFISSIMNRATEDLVAEREAARGAVDHFGPITTPWAFEAEPASPKPLLDFYINGVKSSDLFVLLVGARMTEPVKAEFDTARDHGKPMLVFAKDVPSRAPDADQLLHSANVKYDTFVNATELREKLRRSLGAHLLTLIRGDGEQSFGPGDRAAQVRAFARNHTAVSILPMVPDCQYNSFRVKSVDAGVVTLEKDSNRQSLTVPVQRIEDVLAGAPDEVPRLLLNGRLQWITVPEVWRFFPEKPLPGDAAGLGFAKERARNNPGVPPQIAARVRWTLPENYSARVAEGSAVFYDEDGKYITSAGQILMVQPGR